VGPIGDVDAMEKRKISCLCQESNSAYSLFAISTELSRLRCRQMRANNKITMQLISSVVSLLPSADGFCFATAEGSGIWARRVGQDRQDLNQKLY
jgi:hypothetical protein